MQKHGVLTDPRIPFCHGSAAEVVASGERSRAGCGALQSEEKKFSVPGTKFLSGLGRAPALRPWKGLCWRYCSAGRRTAGLCLCADLSWDKKTGICPVCLV